MKKAIYTLGLLMVLMGLRLEAQTRSPELRFHVGTGFFFDSDTQSFLRGFLPALFRDKRMGH